MGSLSLGARCSDERVPEAARGLGGRVLGAALACVPQKGTVDSNLTLSATRTSILPVSRKDFALAGEIAGVSAGLGPAQRVMRNRRRRSGGDSPSCPGPFLRGQAGRFRFPEIEEIPSKPATAF